MLHFLFDKFWFVIGFLVFCFISCVHGFFPLTSMKHSEQYTRIWIFFLKEYTRIWIDLLLYDYSQKGYEVDWLYNVFLVGSLCRYWHLQLRCWWWTCCTCQKFMVLLQVGSFFIIFFETFDVHCTTLAWFREGQLWNQWFL